MRMRSLSKTFVLVMAMSSVAFVTCLSTLSPAARAATPAPKLIGPLLTRAENATTSWGRDGGISVPLPNGMDFWIFGDTPRYQYQHGKWNLTDFIYGSSAAMVKFTKGSRPTAPLQEVVVGKPNSPNNQPAQFLPSPHTYLPDGSGRLCNKANGGQQAGADRWAQGAALLPDQTNMLITYIDVCVTAAVTYRAEGWGFTEYNYKTNKFTVGATDVFTPAKNGAAISPSQYFGSPIVKGNTIYLFSRTFGTSTSHIYLTTVAANTAALRKPSSYTPVPISGVPAALAFSVAAQSKTHPHLTMYQTAGSFTGDQPGLYRIFTASAPSGPWTLAGTGTLPKCNTANALCNSVYLHPELSSASQMIVTYTLPGYGPGIATHPFPNHALGHDIWVSIPS